MRTEPTWRIPVGLLGLLMVLIVYGIVIARYLPDLIGSWPALAQTVVYVALGLIWLLPLGRFLTWMETGHWR
ncbi:MAG: hypothetical protein CL949_15360 [Erythrobacter sp.]|nr:hypothetical protein [Erythrobacter sp.]|tara:strand:- start:305 stop:520 length:216 start_codon:yes stop_codon:yes gene_type:complete